MTRIPATAAAIDGELVACDATDRPDFYAKALLSDLLAGDVIEKLLQAAADMRLDGIVSKRRTAAYIAGRRCGWVKVKTAEWREANRERHKLFEK